MRGREVKKLLTNPILYVAGLTALPLCAMEAISEREMSEVSGQAFITIGADSYSSSAAEWEAQGLSSDLSQGLSGDFEFTRVNLGLDIETMATADELRVGEFDRTLYEDGTVPATDRDGNTYDLDGDGIADVLPADIMIDNFALGRVKNYQDAVNASLDPFKIRNPYIELAYKVENGVRTIAGVRLGFEKGQGYLSGDIQSLTGVFSGEIRGPISVITAANCPNPDTGDSADSCGILNLAVGIGDPEIYSTIDLVDGAKGTENYGYGAGTEAGETYDDVDENGNDVELPFSYPYAKVPYLKRASWAGVPAGRNFDSDNFKVIGIDLGGIIRSVTVSTKCEVDYTPGCFKLDIYQSVYIGDPTLPFDDEGNGSGGASGVFVSLQNNPVPWKDLSGLPDADRIPTQRGAYLNSSSFNSNGVERYPLVLDLLDATNGISRVATCVGMVKGC
jgi:hypothetical protein